MSGVKDYEKAKVLYDQVLRTSNMFLHNCKYFSVEILQLDQPAYTEIAEMMQAIPRIIFDLADDFDPMLAQKASEYCALMRNIGIAIADGDQLALEGHLRWKGGPAYEFHIQTGVVSASPRTAGTCSDTAAAGTPSPRAGSCRPLGRLIS